MTAIDVSVVIPTVGRTDLLGAALDSVRRQTFEGFEAIIVNDNPDKRTEVQATVDDLGDARFHCLHHSANEGSSVARNTGIAKTRGGIVAFLDDDDIWFPHALDRIWKCHNDHPEAGFVMTGAILQWDGLRRRRVYRAHLPQIGVCEAMRRGKFSPPTTSVVSVKRHCLEVCGTFDAGPVTFEDWDLWFRIAQKYPVTAVDEPLTVYRQHIGERLTTSLQTRLDGLDRLAEKWGETLQMPEFRDNYVKQALWLASLRAGMSGKRADVLRFGTRYAKMLSKVSDVKILLKIAGILLAAGPTFVWIYDSPTVAGLRGRSDEFPKV